MILLRLLLAPEQLRLLDARLAETVAEGLKQAYWPYLHPEDRAIFMEAIDREDAVMLKDLIDRYGLLFIWKPEQGTDTWALRHPWRIA